MALHRTHPKTLLGGVSGSFIFAIGQLPGNVLQSLQVIAHVVHHVFTHHLRQLDELPTVSGVGGCHEQQQYNDGGKMVLHFPVPHPENALDKLIAATALIYDLTVVTRNHKDFVRTSR